MLSAAKQPMSGAQPFKAAVPSVSVPGQGWRAGLERSDAMAGQGRVERGLFDTARAPHARKTEPRSQYSPQNVVQRYTYRAAQVIGGLCSYHAILILFYCDRMLF